MSGVEVLTDLTPRLQAVRAEVADARDRLDAAVQRRSELVVRAIDQGMTQRAVANAVGLSQSRVVAILADSQPDVAVVIPHQRSA